MFDIIPPNSKLIVAVSGGPDSVFLLDKLHSQDLDIHIAHLNHNTRGKKSDEDEIFVKNLAAKLNIPISTKKLKFKKNPSEGYLRKQRYKFLESTRVKQKADYIVTAHHQDDQIETIMHNFIRGTGPAGLIGMHQIQDKIIRPLLHLEKNEILNYLKNNKLEYQTDESNKNSDYTRNYIRNEINPLISKLNPQYSKNILQLREIIKHQQDCIAEQTEIAFKTWNNSLKKFKSYHPAIQTELLRKIIKPYVPTKKQLTYKIISEVRNILLFSQGGSKKLLFNTLSISKKNDKINLRKLRS